MTEFEHIHLKCLMIIIELLSCLAFKEELSDKSKEQILTHILSIKYDFEQRQK